MRQDQDSKKRGRDFTSPPIAKKTKTSHAQPPNAPADIPVSGPDSLSGSLPEIIFEYIWGPVSKAVMQEAKSIPNSSNNNVFFTQLKSKRERIRLQLLKYVVEGKAKKVEDIVKHDPGLALEVVNEAVTHFSGRKISGQSAFQAALGSHDVAMVLMMKHHASEAKNLQELLKKMKSQFKATFSSGVQADRKAQEESCFDFKPILTTIRGAPENQLRDALNLKGASFKNNERTRSTLTTHLNQFRSQYVEHAKKQKPGPYDLLLALNALKNLPTAHRHLPAHCSNGKDRHDVIWRQVIGLVMRFTLPTYYAQAFVYGLGLLINQPDKPLQRTLKLPNWSQNRSYCQNKVPDRNTRFFPSETYSLTGLGFEHAISAFQNTFGDRTNQEGMICSSMYELDDYPRSIRELHSWLTQLISKKVSELEKFYQDLCAEIKADFRPSQSPKSLT